MEENRRSKPYTDIFVMNQSNYNRHPKTSHKDEIPYKLSSFIAQYSYSNDPMKTTGSKKRTKFQQPRHNQELSDIEPRRVSKNEKYNKKQASESDSIKSYQKIIVRGNQQTEHLRNHVQHTPHAIDPSGSETDWKPERKGWRKHFKKQDSQANQGRFEIQPEYNKEISEKTSRPPNWQSGKKSKPRLQRENVARVSSNPYKDRQGQSYSSNTRVKYMPLKYKRAKFPEKKNDIGRYTFVRKHEVSLESPTIHINPKNQNRHIRNFCDSFQNQSLEDLDLPCKCYKCKKRYEELLHLNTDMHELRVKPALKPVCNHHPTIKRKIVQKCPGENLSGISDQITSDCDLTKFCTEGMLLCNNSVKIKSYQICMDPNIAQHFYSILEAINYC